MTRLTARLLIIAIVILAGLLICEILLRGIGVSAPVWYHPDPQLGWTLRPDTAAWFTQEGHTYIEVNAAGWRDQEHKLAKPVGTYRIAVLGDSYTEAMQVSAKEAFWARLPQMLGDCGFARGKRIEIMNFGVSGYGTAQEYLVLESQAIHYRPDLVLLAFANGDDVRNNSRALEEENLRPFYVLNQEGRLQLDNSFVSAPIFRTDALKLRELFRKLADRSRIIQLANAARSINLIRNANAATGPKSGQESEVLAPPRDLAWENAWRVTEKLIAKTNDFAQSKGARFLLVTVPDAIQVHPDPLVRGDLQKKLGLPNLFYPDLRISEFAHGHGISVLALAPEMQTIAEAQHTYFHGFANLEMGRGHWNPDGHRVAAEIIARRLCGAKK